MKITIDSDSSVKGNWGKVGKDVHDNDRLKIMDSGQRIDGKFGEQYVFKFMTMKRDEFNIALNRTSRNTLGRAFGPETEDWSGKVVKAFVVKQMVGDGLKNVLYLAPEGWEMTEEGEFIDPNEVNEPIQKVSDDDVASSIPF